MFENIAIKKLNNLLNNLQTGSVCVILHTNEYKK